MAGITTETLPPIDAVGRQELFLLLCDLLAAAVPLALDRLRTGGVPLLDQDAFWREFQRVEDWLGDVEGYGDMLPEYLGDPGDPVSATFYDLAAAIRRHEQ